MKYFILIAIVSLLTSCSGGENETGGNSSAEAPRDIPPQSLFSAEIEFEDQHGTTVNWSSFYGKPSIVSMIFTNCDYACPLIVEDLKAIDKQLKPGLKNDVQFLLISFDVERDLPDTLREFQKAKSLDKRWHLLHGDESEVRLISNLLEIKYKKDPYGNFSHGNSILVLNKEGIPVARTDELGRGEESIPEALNEL